MERYDFKYDNQWLSDIGGVCTEKPPIEVALRSGKLVEVAGADGEDYVDNGNYLSVKMARQIGFFKRSVSESKDVPYQIIEWLSYRQNRFFSFEDTDHPNMFTYAIITNFAEVNRVLQRINKATIQFTRKPFWYLKSGQVFQVPTPKAATIILENPYPITAQPIIQISFNSNNAIGREVTAPDIAFMMSTENSSQTFTLSGLRYTQDNCIVEINVATQTAKLLGTDTYFDVEIPPELPVGNTSIRCTNGIDSIIGWKIKPCWRSL